MGLDNKKMERGFTEKKQFLKNWLDGRDNLKRQILKGSIVVLLPFVLIMNQGFIRAQEDGDNIVIGKYRVLHSAILDEDRLLTVHLPREYEEASLSYPVMYVLYGKDINNYFAEAVIISEKLGSTGEIPPVIIVGVANTNRYRDNLPTEIKGRPDSGGALFRGRADSLCRQKLQDQEFQDFGRAAGWRCFWALFPHHKTRAF
jgi:hypothetical protein